MVLVLRWNDALNVNVCKTNKKQIYIYFWRGLLTKIGLPEVEVILRFELKLSRKREDSVSRYCIKGKFVNFILKHR